MNLIDDINSLSGPSTSTFLVVNRAPAIIPGIGATCWTSTPWSLWLKVSEECCSWAASAWHVDTWKRRRKPRPLAAAGVLRLLENRVG